MNPKAKMINIGTEFSKYPAGRFRSDGSYSGEVFREDYLIPALNEGEFVDIYLDEALGYGSSFLEEAFGGLVREHHMKSDELHKKIKIHTSKKTVEREIWEYIDQSE